MSSAIQNALMSAAKKALRGIVATALLALAAALPVMKETFQQVAATGNVTEKVIYGAIITGIITVIAFVDRLAKQWNAQP